ncbi:cytochrome P450 [Echria macrotheca]|uniref:Cytochrome P450 n=1 Tax=Echria macrotheca TaxID=438768 RepID=A0AAJ0B8R5_9PEZI|nr:cytochrome P450 [Echria macrotheca]
MAPLLSADAVASHFREVLSCTDELVTKWSSLGDDTNKIQPFPDLNLLNLEATTLTLFGKKLNCITADGPPHPMLQAMEDSTSEAMKRPTRPKLLNFLVYGSKFRRATKAMRAYAQDVIDYRKANPNPDRHDLLWAMQTAKDPETGKSLTDSQVVDEIISMPIGSSTAPCAVAAGILFLTQNPHVVTRAREEIDAVVGEGELTEEHIPRLQYMAGVVRETLRLSFAAPGFNIEPIPREGDKSPVLLGGGKYEIAHDQAMIIVLAGVNRDPAVFEEPTAFRPERMVGEAFEKLPAGVKKWFGNGKRECIGKHWAWEFLVVVMTELIRKLDFEAAEPGYAMKQDGWFNVRPIDLSVKVKPRAV